ncbi:MAG: SsrA-binding protein SmpB [Minisyncoccia bacterium]|jgi:SsrA-binding protein
MSSLAFNKRANFDYEIEEKFEAGIELKGYEVKAVKNGHMQIAGSYAVIRHNEVWLLNSHIPPYQPKNTPKEYDPARSRRLLLTKKETSYLSGKLHEKGLTLLPLEVYTKRGLIKIKLGLGKPLKKSDKREIIRKRETKKEIERALRE